ncbi:hypothetical protein [Nonomuraea sp. NPDC050310]|uniref:hypothetical protein n=1 Tax=Nonomuraea sp. NPDC050310 TaxID=3154935 RepID=UPI0033DFFEC2
MKDLLLHELRRAGPAAWAGPPALLATGLGLAVLGPALNLREGLAGMFILGLLQGAFPLTAGVAAASLVRDDAAELLHSLPGGFRRTLFRRLAVLVAMASAGALVLTLIAVLTGHADRWGGDPLTQLTWFGPLLGLTGLGFCLTAGMRSAAAGGTVITLVWGIQLVADWGIPWFLRLFENAVPAADWLPNRLALLSLGLALVVLAWFMYGRAERFLGRESE